MSQNLADTSVKLSALTAKTYAHILNKFKRYVGASSEEQLLRGSIEEIRGDISDFLKSKVNKSYRTRCLYSSALRSFYRQRGIVFSDPFSLYPDRYDKTNSWLNPRQSAYKSADIHRLLVYSPEREKAAICLLATTGLQPRTLCSLKLTNLTPLRTGAYYIYVRDGHKTFCTPQTGRFFRTYLDNRRNQGEKLTPDSPVLTGYYAHKGSHLSFIALFKNIEAVAADAGIRQYNDYDNKLVSKSVVPLLAGFRYFALDSFKQAGISPDHVDILAGRKPKTLPTDRNIESLYEQYRKAIPLLTFSSL